MVKNNGDIFSSIFFMGYALLLIILSFSIKQLEGLTVGPAFVPRLVAVGIFIFSAVLLINGIKKKKQTANAEENGAVQESVNYRSVLSTVALMIVYVALIGPLGFVVSTTLYLILQFILLTDKSHWKIPLYVVIAILTSGCVYYVFKIILHVMLPSGILG